VIARGRGMLLLDHLIARKFHRGKCGRGDQRGDHHVALARSQGTTVFRNRNLEKHPLSKLRRLKNDEANILL
jgi:hypothetical protein